MGLKRVGVLRTLAERAVEMNVGVRAYMLASYPEAPQEAASYSPACRVPRSSFTAFIDICLEVRTSLEENIGPLMMEDVHGCWGN
jgi:hypothetical protein